MKNSALACFGLVIVVGTLMIPSEATAEAEEERSLGHFPLCEASSALTLICPDGTNDCLIVGDNEQRNELFLFKVTASAVDSSSQRKLSLQLSQDDELSDIEAMVPMSADTILILGSHSRNTKFSQPQHKMRSKKEAASFSGS